MIRFLIATLCMTLVAACRDDATPTPDSVQTEEVRTTVSGEPSPTTIATPAPTRTVRPQPTENASPPAGQSLPTIEEIYARVGESLRQPGMLYHATVTIETSAESFIRSGATELWIDAHRNLAREERMSEIIVQQHEVTFDTTTIRFADAEITQYRSPDERLETGKAPVCYGAPASVATLLECPGGLEESTTTVEWGNVDGRSAIILVTIGTSRGEDEAFDFTERLYLDSDTMLPIVRETEGTHTWGPVHVRDDYKHAFIAQDAISADLFDPVTFSLNDLADIKPAMPAYWLGTQADPEGELPSLVIFTSRMSDDTTAGDFLYLSYRSAEPHFHLSGPLVTEILVEQLPRDVWEADKEELLQTYWADDECGEQIDVALPNGHATIFLGFLDPLRPSSFGPSPTPSDATICPPDQPHKRFEAVAYFDETVVYLNAPTESSYRSREGLEAVLRLLQPFDPSELTP